MNREDRHTLEDLIEDLLDAQSKVDVCLATVSGYRAAVISRDAIKQRLIEFVEELEARNETP